MRKCIRCNNEMETGYGLKVSNLTVMGTVLLAKGNSILSDELGKVKVAICPKCGLNSLKENAEQLEKRLGRTYKI